jgi:UDP-N-acetylglucosamine--N-acetylmuramyl-(pentapeptide) pyrophosphoryl-undecaprenol N-acetylglucosamine transferase
LAGNLHVVIACGGTGGHLFPGIAVAEELRGRGHEVLLLISRKEVDREGSGKYGELRFVAVEAVAKPATFSPAMVPFLWRLGRSTLACRKLLQGFEADAVLGMGGFTSMPPVLAGHWLGARTFVHESNALPGKANRLTARFCNKVLVGWEAAAERFGGRPTVVTGTPVRKELEQLPRREDAAAAFGLDPARPVVLVMGGSQGAQRLNRLAPAAAERVRPRRSSCTSRAGGTKPGCGPRLVGALATGCSAFATGWPRPMRWRTWCCRGRVHRA